MTKGRDVAADTRQMMRFGEAMDRLERAAATATKLEDMGLDDLARGKLQDGRRAIEDAATAYGDRGRW